MSRNVYGKINDLRSSYIKLGGFYLNDIAIKTFELLLEIVNDKNDDEFSDFFIKYILGFEFKNKYYHHKYKYLYHFPCNHQYLYELLSKTYIHKSFLLNINPFSLIY